MPYVQTSESSPNYSTNITGGVNMTPRQVDTHSDNVRNQLLELMHPELQVTHNLPHNSSISATTSLGNRGGIDTKVAANVANLIKGSRETQHVGNTGTLETTSGSIGLAGLGFTATNTKYNNRVVDKDRSLSYIRPDYAIKIGKNSKDMYAELKHQKDKNGLAASLEIHKPLHEKGYNAQLHVNYGF